MGGRITHNGYPHARNREVILYRDVLLLFIEWFDVGWSNAARLSTRHFEVHVTFLFTLTSLCFYLTRFTQTLPLFIVYREKSPQICNPIRHISYSFICFWNVSSSLWYRTYTCRTIGNPHHFNQANIHVHTVCHW